MTKRGRGHSVARQIMEVLSVLILVPCVSGLSVAYGQLPAQSERIANYTMEARLDPDRKTVHGREILVWRNTSTEAISDFYFHLYLNAFKNNRSTYFLEGGGTNRLKRKLKDDEWGYCRVERVKLLSDSNFAETDLTPTLAYVQPDDDNKDDQTVFRVSTPRPLPPAGTIQMEIQFTTKLPLAISRSGFKGDFFFVAQWFPKIGVFAGGRWNCHQFHAHSEFFADFGVYDVRITVPARFVVGATGLQTDRQGSGDTVTYRFFQEDVHDFAWAASPDFKVVNRKFTHPKLRSVDVQLLLQPEHVGQAERHFRAVFHGLKYFGEWYGEYPYPTLTVVDPAYGASVGGMEYPTLITAGTRWWAPEAIQSPEFVIVHEFGHQFWYGLVANNEFEEAWLDEGFNTYSTAKVLDRAYGDNHFLRRYFGGIPFVSREIKFGRHDTDREDLRAGGRKDEMARRSWEYDGTYVLNSYAKPGLVLYTLENILGEEVMARVMRAYHARWRFKHPTTRDFIATVNELSGRDMTEFFNQTFFSSSLVDYAVESIANRDESEREGIFDPASTPMKSDADDKSEARNNVSSQGKDYHSEVLVRRIGEARLPVEVLVRFEGGSERRESWDGRYRWKKFLYDSAHKVTEAIVDPEHKIALDVNPANNGRQAEPKPAWGARKWAARWLFWFQHLLETIAFLS